MESKTVDKERLLHQGNIMQLHKEWIRTGSLDTRKMISEIKFWGGDDCVNGISITLLQRLR